MGPRPLNPPPLPTFDTLKRHGHVCCPVAKVVFTADPRLPADQGGKRWLHSWGGRKLDSDGKTWRMVEPTYFESGKTYDVSDADAAWLVNNIPTAFKPPESPKVSRKPIPPPDPDEPETD